MPAGVGGGMAGRPQQAGVRVSVAADKPVGDIKLASAYESGCDKGGCDKGGSVCADKSGECLGKACGCEGTCCCCCVTFRFFGDYLYLRARDNEVCYAVESNINCARHGPDSAIAHRHRRSGPKSGFRAGFGVGLDACTEIAVTYTNFETSSTERDHAVVNPIHQISSMTVHPSTGPRRPERSSPMPGTTSTSIWSTSTTGESCGKATGRT